MAESCRAIYFSAPRVINARSRTRPASLSVRGSEGRTWSSKGSRLLCDDMWITHGSLQTSMRRMVHFHPAALRVEKSQEGKSFCYMAASTMLDVWILFMRWKKKKRLLSWSSVAEIFKYEQDVHRNNTLQFWVFPPKKPPKKNREAALQMRFFFLTITLCKQGYSPHIRGGKLAGNKCEVKCGNIYLIL